MQFPSKIKVKIMNKATSENAFSNKINKLFCKRTIDTERWITIKQNNDPSVSRPGLALVLPGVPCISH